mgnify:CR=1 FL=1
MRGLLHYVTLRWMVAPCECCRLAVYMQLLAQRWRPHVSVAIRLLPSSSGYAAIGTEMATPRERRHPTVQPCVDGDPT